MLLFPRLVGLQVALVALLQVCKPFHYSGRRHFGNRVARRIVSLPASATLLPIMMNTSLPHEDHSSAQIRCVSETLFGLLGLSGSTQITTAATRDGARVVLHDFLQFTALPTTDILEDVEKSLSYCAVMAAQQLCQISTYTVSTQMKKQTWQALQASTANLQTGSSMESNALAISLVFGALSLLQTTYNGGDLGADAKAAASALSSTTSRNKPLRHSGRSISKQLLQTYLAHATHTDTLNLHILTHFAKAFKLGGEDCIDPSIGASVVVHALRVNDNRDANNMEGGEKDPHVLSKQRVSGALALACQLQPWSVITPESLVDAAIPFELWHSAEDICRVAYEAAVSSNPSGADSDGNNGGFSQAIQRQNTRRAVERLIDAAMEDRMYRRADALATSLYEAGGVSRYVEARFNHACETISKVVYRRKIPIVDRQIERIDKAAAKVAQDDAFSDQEASVDSNTNWSERVQTTSPSLLSFDPSSEIRKFAIEKLEEAGEFTAAKRLASVFGIDYVYDERALISATAMRRRRYLQYDDVLPGAIPNLIADPKDLVVAFEQLRKDPFQTFGLDAEWDEETKGASVLQLANAKMVLLIDIPALLGTQDGVYAMEQTVGSLLDCPDSTVVGFACRQDLSRLHSSPCFGREKQGRWISGTKAVIDAQCLVGKAEPKLDKAGLSRICQHFFGKPLDKAEQCSLWSARPLSDHQRSYAALDAWVCVAIYQKLVSSLNHSSTKMEV